MTFVEILLHSKVLDSQKLSSAERKAKQDGILLPEAILRLNLATEEQVAVARAQELGMPFASRKTKTLRALFGQNLDKLVDEQFARENIVVPLWVEKGVLTAAMQDPTNMMVIENMKLKAGIEIRPCVATKSEILHTIDELYGRRQNALESAVDEVTTRGSEEGEVEISDTEGRLNLDKFAAGKGTHIVKLVDAALRQAIREKASDIHLECFDTRVSLRFRIDGVLYDRTAPGKDDYERIISRIKILSKLNIAEHRLPQDGTFSITLQNRTIEVRVSTLPALFAEKVVLRLIDRSEVDLGINHLGFEPQQCEYFLEAARHPHGLIILTGPTGSGKTTTLYSVLSAIKSPEKNYLTIEDPIEIKMDGVTQVQVKPAIGLDYASAIRAFLRQDPDVILVGEVRDQETATTCMRAALTGHLVLSTLHTNDAMGAVIRLIDLGIEPYLLSSSLHVVAAQRLVRILCSSCKVAYQPERGIFDKYVRESGDGTADPEKVVFYKSVGCERCAQTGYMGRRAVYEVYQINDEMREIINRDPKTGDLLAAARRSGMPNLRASAWRKVRQGVTSVSEVLDVTMA